MSLISRSLIAAALLGAALAAPVAQAQEGVRIGFVNTDRMLREAAPAKAAQTKLEQEFSRREKEIDEAGAALKVASERFEREAATMSDTQRQTRQRQLMDQDRDFQRRRREFQEDLNARKQEELQQILDRANRVVRQVAEANKYDVILQEAVYINPRLDITDKVIQALNGGK
ncbi:MAG: OmpH family outer membrane protein [Pseudomonadota bacterium]|nr:OmpH family outer membrane protein [Pseudomonadota bacterium]